MSAQPSSGSKRTRGGRGFLIFNAWLLWLIALAFALVFFLKGHKAGVMAPAGMKYMMWMASVILLLPYIPLRALDGWRCRRASKHLPEAWRSGTAELPGWPGVHDRGGEVTLRCGSSAFRLWALAVGVALSGYLMHRLGRGVDKVTPFDFLLSLAPAICTLFGSLLWGKSGWQLSVDSARSQAMLILWRALRRSYYASVSLPMVQGVELAGDRGRGYRGIVIRRAKGNDWKLGLPSTWTPELAEALGARLANQAGVKFEMPEEGPALPAEPQTDTPPTPGPETDEEPRPAAEDPDATTDKKTEPKPETADIPPEKEAPKEGGAE